MKPGDKVVCTDDEGWLLELKTPSPRKGGIYVIREFSREFGVAAVSLVSFDPDFFYRACRFKPVLATGIQEDRAAITQP